MTMLDSDSPDMGPDPEVPLAAARRSPGGRTRFLAVGGFAAAGLAAGVAGTGAHFDFQSFGSREAAGQADSAVRQIQSEATVMTVDDKSQIVVEGADAQERNAALPVSGLPLERVGAFSFANAGEQSQATALKCMTQAIYYEAGHEPVEGRRAVAQVVLNRLRHPAYPKSVCGVVYEGSERRTGCQFSFTCDGSLLRKPEPGAWREAEGIARAALAGHVEKGVGTATHYHADYVLPKWAFRLGKITQLGRHIFYRFKGGWGRSAAFTARYSGLERIPAIDFAALRARVAADGDLLASRQFVPGLTVTPHVTDRHAENDVGGRLDMTKQWRLSIPDPAQASSRYQASLAETSEPEAASRHVAMAEPDKPAIVQ